MKKAVPNLNHQLSSKRKQAEKALRKTAEKFDALLWSVSDCISMLDKSCITLQSFQDGGIHEHDTQVIGKDGQTIWFHCTANVVLKDYRGNPTAVLKTSRDITKRKQVEKTLRNRKKNTKHL